MALTALRPADISPCIADVPVIAAGFRSNPSLEGNYLPVPLTRSS